MYLSAFLGFVLKFFYGANLLLMTKKKISLNFKKFLALKNCSLDKVARLANLSLNTVLHLESGTNKNPTIDTIKKIDHTLKICTDN